MPWHLEVMSTPMPALKVPAHHLHLNSRPQAACLGPFDEHRRRCERAGRAGMIRWRPRGNGWWC